MAGMLDRLQSHLFEMPIFSDLGKEIPFTLDKDFGECCRVTVLRKSDYKQDGVAANVLEQLDYAYTPVDEFNLIKVYYRYIKAASDTTYSRGFTFWINQDDLVCLDPSDINKEIEEWCYKKIAENESNSPL